MTISYDNQQSDPAQVDQRGAVLTGTDLHLSFGQTHALRGASLSVRAGEIVAVMGASGSGKSTLLHCLAGILAPDSGRVDFAGRDVTAMNDVQRSALRRSEFGFVFQFGQLVPELSVVENVALPLRLGGTKSSGAASQAKTWLERLGVADVADKRPGEISGGQGQRVAMARALISRPKVIFADEPTGALDTLNGEQVMTLLADTAHETDAAVVLVTHEPTVAAFADREVIVRDGSIRAEDTVQ
ncbi:ABC transporter ATP-binding protein [Actinoalloteichus hymeniacidonis]|uniref:ABC-type antimicrobial peptide transport system, ATPase component n=1 Tax=Actinoalloteichus hymeniacidonis TaxID=340345 RepID=A0AAC9HUU6_9PSEU|nr:ABC transporter ATP-binding protein [Actinoalloteichus hymeniacidonis]AOS65868.1 ABC-type antimicrobial peptide transport system, ATPase component [Actinoalloteichus hymeniacidonis]MBB5906038.1 putative ABC transport system ATP-binding protein [Actinoalloteichus hymeniacidonis]